MHKYEELEKLYYKKKYLKYFYIFIFLLIIVVGVLFIINLNSTKSSKIKTTQSPIKTTKPIIKKDIKSIKKENNSSKVIKSKPIKQQIKEKKEIKKITKIKNKENYKLVLYPIFPEIDNKKNIEKKLKHKNKNIIKEKKQKSEPLKIIVKTSKQTLKNLIYIYNKSPEYDRALQIANIYFKKQNYKETIEWAKKANIIKPEDSKSWIVFAKSLIKLGKKNKAKEVLISYLNTYGADKNIEKLLRSIK